MSYSEESESPPLVRRVLLGTELREFAHPVDGSPAQERRLASVDAEPSEPLWGPPGEHPGQLDWQEVTDELCQLPLHLPILKASCDASGACCGLHHHVPVTEEERTGIFETLATDWEAPAALDVLVHRAYDRGNDGSFNIASVEGSCAFQRSDGLCELHARGGPMAKPMACRSFPSMLVLCGEEWHASLLPECACLQRTAIEGSALQYDSSAWVSLRSHQRWVASVPEQLCLSEGQHLSRDSYLRWLRELLAVLQTSFEPIVAVREATALLGTEVSARGSSADGRPPQAWLDDICLWLDGWQGSLGDAWGPRSAYARGMRWALSVARELASEPSIAAPSWSRGRSRDWNRRQASLLSLFLHGHGLLGAEQLLAAAEDLGHFAWLARASNAVCAVETQEPTLESMTLWMFFWRTLAREKKH